MISSKLALFWERITFSRTTKFYFIFSLLHCFVQVVFQIQAFSINAQAADFLYKLIQQGDAFDPGFSVMTGSELRFCDTVPSSFSTTSCQLIWSASSSGGTAANHTLNTESLQSLSTTEATSSISPSTASSSSVPSPSTSIRTERIYNGKSVVQKRSQDGNDGSSIGLITTVNVNGSTEVTINGLGWNNDRVSLSQRCLYTLNWPLEKLEDTKREDAVFIAFQLWVLGMSIVAILNESMPHIIATLLTHVVATAWGGFQISQTTSFRTLFNKLTTDGACEINLLPTYWKERSSAEIPSSTLNGAALLFSVFLSWRLLKLFGWQTFKRVGASRKINRLYMLVLVFSIAIQLSLFFIVVSIALWIDQLYNGSIGRLATSWKIYRAVLISVLLLLIPWLAMGWIAVRRELKLPMMAFLVMSFGYLGGWSAMFTSATFRWTFVSWRFFSLMASSSVLLTLVTFVLGIICRVNFGKGLPRYLSAQQPLPSDKHPAPRMSYYSGSNVEKVEFPSARPPVPTFSATFGKGDEVPPPGLMQFGPPVARQISSDAVPPYGAAYVREPRNAALPRSLLLGNASRTLRVTQLSRQLSSGSQGSTSSSRSNGSSISYKSNGQFRNKGFYYSSSRKSWVIE